MADSKEITITAPNPGFSGLTAGVRFTDGVAKVTDRQHAALEYFARHGFGISDKVEASVDELDIEKQPAPASNEAAELGKLTRAELDDIAKTEEVDTTSAKNKEDVAALILAKRATPKVPVAVNSGPIGPQHNQGQDGADPSNGTPQTTPTDAGI